MRDIPISMAPCGVTVVAGAVTAVSLNEHDYWENALFDAREAQTRDATATSSTDIPLAGVMHYVELDVNNLRRWLAGQLVAAGGINGANAKNDNGYILYFSDRRGKNAGAAAELQGEFGYEDNVNPATSGGAANNTLDAGEDANGTLPSTSSVARRATFRPARRHRVLRDIPIPCTLGRWSRRC